MLLSAVPLEKVSGTDRKGEFPSGNMKGLDGVKGTGQHNYAKGEVRGGPEENTHPCSTPFHPSSLCGFSPVSGTHCPWQV